MGFKKLLLPAALIAAIGMLAPRANAQTMGEYPTTVGVATGNGSMSTPLSQPGPTDLGGSSSTWGASGVGSSWDERAGAASGAGLGADFSSRVTSMTNGSGQESRWPGTNRFSSQGSGESSNRFDTVDRFSSGDRFAAGDRFSSADRWPSSSFSNHMGLDTNFNPVNSR